MEPDGRRDELPFREPRPPPSGRAAAPGPRQGLRMRAGRRRLLLHNRQLARALCSVAPALRPSFLRRPRDHGRSSRETDQDQNRRGEAVRNRQRLLSLVSWRPERLGSVQARGGRRTPGLTWGSAAGGDGAGTDGARRCRSPLAGSLFPASPPEPLRSSGEGGGSPTPRAPRSGSRRDGGRDREAGPSPGSAPCARAPGFSALLPGGRRVQSITCPQVDAQARSEVSGVRGEPGHHQK